MYYTQEAWEGELAALYKVSVDPSLDIENFSKPSLTYHDGWISIEEVNTNEYLYIYNVIGQLVQSINKSKPIISLDLSQNGVYFIVDNQQVKKIYYE